MLPTVPQGIFPAHCGNTDGRTEGSTGGTPGLIDLCAEAEASGAGGLWAVDHLFWPGPVLECLTTLSVASVATERVPIGSCVLQLPLRRPAAVAKQAAALQLLSGGRFVLGVGVGSHQGEYEAAGVDYRRRGRLLDEGLAEVRRAWASAADPGAPYRQAPAADPVPVWIGGASDAAIARAARTGDGWVPVFLEPDEYRLGLRRLREAEAAAGRPPGAVTAAVVVMARVGGPEAAEDGARWLSSLYGAPPKAFERHLVAGPADRCAERLAEYHSAGAEHVVVMTASDVVEETWGELLGRLARPGPAETPDRATLMEVMT
ncbi:MAG TPA: LLM class flavin-dependent oxidoreductase [Acidimicrobiales bacterium]|nr:LLM class flavin-dependent oxidoreductase [Acidimicrobiales bacterium]